MVEKEIDSILHKHTYRKRIFYLFNELLIIGKYNNQKAPIILSFPSVCENQEIFSTPIPKRLFKTSLPSITFTPSKTSFEIRRFPSRSAQSINGES